MDDNPRSLADIDDLELVTVKVPSNSVLQEKILNIQQTNRLIQKRHYSIQLDKTSTRVASAFKYVHQKASQGERFGLKDILEIHSLLGGSGTLRSPSLAWFDDNNIGVGSYHTPPDSKNLQSLLEKYIRKYSIVNESEEPLEKICATYFVFELIHPFGDMNGRTGRLLCAWLMVLYGYQQITPYLEVEWGDNQKHREAFESGLSSYRVCLSKNDHLNRFYSYNFYPYFLDQIQAILKRIAEEEKLTLR